MSYNTEEMLKYLNSDEGKKKMEAAVQEMIDKENKRKDFESRGQDEVMVKVLRTLERDGRLDGETLSYFPEKYDFTKEEFRDLFLNMQDYAEDNGFAFEDEKCMFENKAWHCLFQGAKIIFKTMNGQGTARWLEIASDKDWNADRSFEYNEYRGINF
jgi:hypothetical protein